MEKGVYQKTSILVSIVITFFILLKNFRRKWYFEQDKKWNNKKFKNQIDFNRFSCYDIKGIYENVDVEE